MRKKKLREMSLEELILKEKMLKIALTIFLLVLMLLVAVLIIMITRNGVNPLIAVPLALIPVFIYSKKELNDLRAEISVR